MCHHSTQCNIDICDNILRNGSAFNFIHSRTNLFDCDSVLSVAVWISTVGSLWKRRECSTDDSNYTYMYMLIGNFYATNNSLSGSMECVTGVIIFSVRNWVCLVCRKTFLSLLQPCPGTGNARRKKGDNYFLVPLFDLNLKWTGSTWMQTTRAKSFILNRRQVRLCIHAQDEISV